MPPFDWPITSRADPELRAQLPHAMAWLARSPAAARDAGLAERLLDALLDGAPWLDHPVLAPITMGLDDARLDARLVAWLTHHGGGDGDPSPTPRAIRLDPDWQALGPIGIARLDLPPDWSWAVTPPASAAERAELIGHCARFDAAIAWFATMLPAAHRWCAAVTAIVFPYRPAGMSRFRSASRTDLPGAIFLDISVPRPLLLEGLVHESAHRHWFRWEAEAPLVDPAHRDRYHSPLRPDPRPLRGIYLAWHALTYMVLLHEALEDVGAVPRGSREVADLRVRTSDAEAVLRGVRAHLTDHGMALFAETAAAASARGVVAVHG